MTRIGNRKVQFIILLTLVCLVGTMSIAYAILSTTLNINGTAQVQDASWNVHFDNIQVNPNSVEINPVITDNNKVTFSADLTTPGEFYKFSIDIVNEGSIDAMIESIAKTPELTVDEKKYLKYEVEYIDGTPISNSQLLKSGETKTINVLFSYRNDIPVSDLPTTERNFDLEIVLVYVQADSTGIEIAGNEKLVKIVSGDLNTVGSEIAIGDEHFYLIKNDSSSITMLSKYNLHVGNKYDSTNKKVPLENPTGIQDETAIGFFSGYSESNPIIGTIDFASTNYWYSDGLKPEYGTSYPVYVYNSNSNLYQHVENYGTYLSTLGATVEQIRLINIDELIELGCSKSSYSCTSSSYSWLYSTSYWTGSAYSLDYIWRVTNGGVFDSIVYTNSGSFGLRPVVKISLEDFS